jgi:hypothetical protein
LINPAISLAIILNLFYFVNSFVINKLPSSQRPVTVPPTPLLPDHNLTPTESDDRRL